MKWSMVMGAVFGQGWAALAFGLGLALLGLAHALAPSTNISKGILTLNLARALTLTH